MIVNLILCKWIHQATCTVLYMLITTPVDQANEPTEEAPPAISLESEDLENILTYELRLLQ